MPLIILATAMEAFNAIQKGCEIYKEVKGTVKKAKETYDQVNTAVQEVKSFWRIVLEIIRPQSKPKPKIVLTKTVDKPIELEKSKINEMSEFDVTKNLMDNLKVFFTCLDQLNQKVKDAEQASLDPTKNVLSSALDIEYAISEVEKLQIQIRETMVYQSPPELGDLYRRVIKRVGVIKEQQELARMDAEREKKNKETKEWLRRNLIITEVTTLGLVLLTVIIVWMVWMPLIVRHGYH